MDGADPTGDVDVRAKITVIPPVEETPGFEVILGILAIASFAAIWTR